MANLKYNNEEIIDISKKMVEVINLFRQEVKGREYWKSPELIAFAKGKVALYQFIPSILAKAGFTRKVSNLGLQFSTAEQPVNYKEISEFVRRQIEDVRGYCAKNSAKKKELKKNTVEAEAPKAADTKSKIIDVKYCIDFLKNRVKSLSESIDEKKHQAVALMTEGDLKEAKKAIEDIQFLEEEKQLLRIEIMNI